MGSPCSFRTRAEQASEARPTGSAENSTHCPLTSAPQDAPALRTRPAAAADSRRRLGVDGTDAAVSASVNIGKVSEYAFGLSAELDIYLPKVPAEQRQQVVALAHANCPYSNATRGNMAAVLTLVY